jgi:hypothetical protein
MHSAVPNKCSVLKFACFFACLHSHYKLLLPVSCPSVCLSVHLSACISVAATRQISVKFDTGDSVKVCQEIHTWFKLGGKKY